MTNSEGGVLDTVAEELKKSTTSKQAIIHFQIAIAYVYINKLINTKKRSITSHTNP